VPQIRRHALAAVELFIQLHCRDWSACEPLDLPLTSLSAVRGGDSGHTYRSLIRAPGCHGDELAAGGRFASSFHFLSFRSEAAGSPSSFLALVRPHAVEPGGIIRSCFWFL